MKQLTIYCAILSLCALTCGCNGGRPVGPQPEVLLAVNDSPTGDGQTAFAIVVGNRGDKPLRVSTLVRVVEAPMAGEVLSPSDLADGDFLRVMIVLDGVTEWSCQKGMGYSGTNIVTVGGKQNAIVPFVLKRPASGWGDTRATVFLLKPSGHTPSLSNPEEVVARSRTVPVAMSGWDPRPVSFDK
ncbi:MAG TPA: hypothetical protein PKC18_21050 [Lacipirellulaceae bacterium]|nr:hypothetical protein [Lacipirellulaceae bacterium]